MSYSGCPISTSFGPNHVLVFRGCPRPSTSTLMPPKHQQGTQGNSRGTTGGQGKSRCFWNYSCKENLDQIASRSCLELCDSVPDFTPCHQMACSETSHSLLVRNLEPTTSVYMTSAFLPMILKRSSFQSLRRMHAVNSRRTDPLDNVALSGTGIYSIFPAAGPTAVACLVLGSMPISATPPTPPRLTVTTWPRALKLACAASGRVLGTERLPKLARS